MAEGEVGKERGFGEGADGFGVERLGFGTEQNAGGGVVFLRELPGIEIVGRCEDPGVGRDGGDGVGEETKRASGGRCGGCVGRGDEDGFTGEGEGKVAERGVECVLRKRDQTDEEATGAGCGSREIDVGLGSGHRAFGLSFFDGDSGSWLFYCDG